MNFDQLQKLITTAVDDMKAVDIKTIDVRGQTSVTDLVCICSGTSSRHVKSIADNVAVEAKKAGLMPLGIEGDDTAEWVLVDLGDAVIHVMQPNVRMFYQLESLWEATAAARENASSPES